MEMIKLLDIRHNGQRNYRWALFKCPKCNKEIERMKHQGVVQEQCTECFREYHKQTQIKHGDRYTRLYRVWINMRSRCNNSKEMHYPRYGGRGISITKEWDKYENFKKWALNNGYKDNLTIDRINVDGNYEPSNCTFIDNKVNAGKDKIVISVESYNAIKELIRNGSKVADAYTSLGYSRTAYYNARKRYDTI